MKTSINQNKMNRLLIILTISIVFASCTSETDNLSNTDKINSYKKQIEELSLKIEDIEKNSGEVEYTGLKIPVKVEEIVAQPFSHSFTATGELESIAEAFISPEVNGQIISINVSEGEYVKKGQLLARLNTVVIDKNIIEVKSPTKEATKKLLKIAVIFDSIASTLRIKKKEITTSVVRASLSKSKYSNNKIKEAIKKTFISVSDSVADTADKFKKELTIS